MKNSLILICLAIVDLAITNAPAAEIVEIPLTSFPWMTDDGKRFAGAQIGGEAAIWSREEGLVGLGIVPGAASMFPRGISADGSVVVGSSNLGAIGGIAIQEAFRWNKETGLRSLGSLPNYTSSLALAASDNGSTVVGYSYDPSSTAASLPWTWTAGTGMSPLPLPQGATSATLRDTSSDGSVILGNCVVRGVTHSFIWDRVNGFEMITNTQSSGHVLAKRLSSDGTTVFGQLNGNNGVPFLWTREEGVVPLPGLPAAQSGFTYDVTRDGSIIVGELFSDAGDTVHPFVWDQQHGTQNVRQILIDQHGFLNADLPPFRGLWQISEDAMSLVVGNISPSRYWAVYLDKPLITLDKAEWKVDSSGNWSQAGNWTMAVPDAAGAVGVFGNTITQARTVTLDAPTKVGRIELDNANAYTLAGGGTLILDANNISARINVTSGSHVISAPMTLADNTVITVTPSGSNLSITGALDVNFRSITKAGAGTLTLNNLRRASALSINGGAVTIAVNGTDAGTSLVGALTIAGGTTPTAKLDLANNAAIINYTGSSPLATIRQQILAGRGGLGLGKPWNGNGITSSAAGTANVADPDSRSVAYAENSALPLGAFATFRGQPVDDTSILIAYTRTGDANLDGVVNDDDVTIVGATYAPGLPQASWALGDFDFSGFIDDDDVTLLGAFYDPNAAPLASAASAVAAVPEPATWALACIGVLVILVAVHRRRPLKHNFLGP
jgi:uncharacterized membrane protein